MKLRMLTTALVLAAVASAPASAMISKQGLDRAVNSAIANGSINTSINGDTVTLYGVVDGSYEANKARHAALNIDGVNKVINRLTANR